MTRYNRILSLSTLVVGSLVLATQSYGFFLDGNGYFGTRGETRVNPEFQKNAGTYQATELSFDLNGEIRANDRASFNLRLGIFEDPNAAYLGDTPKPGNCASRRTSSGTNDTNCEGRHQSTNDPGYKDYKPVIREAYAKYAFNYCVLTAGRRSRDLGLGLLYSSAKKPFETDPSIFDGVTCDVNIQKQQDLGFYFGFDKLQETASALGNPADRPIASGSQAAYDSQHQSKGANASSDDLDQIFFGITLDDLRTKGQGASFAKQVSIYFSNILGDDGKTDVKFLDLYTGLYSGKFAFKNEVVFRMGKSVDPSYVELGGKRDGDDGVASNNVQSIGLAGEMEYTWSRSGASLGPAEFNEGNAVRHLSYLTYAYAPGDENGYYEDHPNAASTANDPIDESKRKTKTKAMAFHKNYKPAMLFFNGKATSKSMTKGGVFNPQRVSNATLFSLGYRYESQENGNFDVRMITGRLLESMPGEVKSYWETQPTRPVGYAGNDLGYELDLMYSWQYRKEVELGAGIAGALPGKAWKVSDEAGPTTQLGLLGSFALKF